MKRDMEKIIREVNVDDKFDISIMEMRKLSERFKDYSMETAMEVIYDAFCFGYAQGQKAQKKSQGRA